MELGLTMFVTDTTVSPVEMASAAEERGFESVFFPEHTHIPTSRRTPYPIGGELPEEYKRTHDPFVALAAAAAATTTLKIGTGVCLVAQRDPIVLAKEVASLDRLSGGRFIFGIGYGWNADEMEDHGVDPRSRRQMVREKTLAMKALWTRDVAGFEGNHVRFGPSWSWPKPVQSPHPPILIGGAAGPTLFRHIAEYADGWMPLGGSGLQQSWGLLREAAGEVGRDPASLQVGLIWVNPDPGSLTHYSSLGVTRAVLPLPAADRSTVLKVMDRYAPLIDQVS